MPFVTADQILCSLIGDYVLQSDAMAQRKTSSKPMALFHAVVYTLPFLALTQRWEALTFICLTHAVIDHYRLARYVCWLKNFLAPRRTVGLAFDKDCSPLAFGYEVEPGSGSEKAIAEEMAAGNEQGWRWARKPERWWHPWSECKGTGYHKDRPPWMAVWLMIITDNCCHLICNAAALKLWGE